MDPLRRRIGCPEPKGLGYRKIYRKWPQNTCTLPQTNLEAARTLLDLAPFTEAFWGLPALFVPGSRFPSLSPNRGSPRAWLSNWLDLELPRLDLRASERSPVPPAGSDRIEIAGQSRSAPKKGEKDEGGAWVAKSSKPPLKVVKVLVV